MSIDAFLKTPEWARLSVYQKMWLRSYLASDDLALAAQMAYPGVALEHLRTFSYKVRKQPRVQAALNRYFNRREKDVQLAQITRDIKRAKGSKRERLLQLYDKTVGTTISKIRKKKKSTRSRHE